MPRTVLLFVTLVAFEISLQACTALPAAQNGHAGHSVAVHEDSDGVKTLDIDPDHCTWVESAASVTFGDQDTKHQAFAQAVMEARTKAMQHLLGVRLEHRFIDFQQENSLKGQAALTEHLLRATQLGRSVKEEVIWAGLVDEGGCIGCRFKAHIRTCIVPEQERIDKHFQVNVRLNRLSYLDGDEAFITVTCSQDAYLYVYDIDMDLNATLMFPNDYARDSKVKAGEALVYPSGDLRAKGVHAVARLVPGSTVSAEMIRVIASKTPLPKSVTSLVETNHKNVRSSSEMTRKGAFLNLMRRLMGTDVEWVEDAQAFTIRKE